MKTVRAYREACDRIRERRLGRLSATLLDISFPHLFKDIEFLTFVDTLSPTRPEKLTATYELELYRYSAYEFDLLAGEYMKLNPTVSQLSEWLMNLSGLVEKEVFRRWRLRWDIHIAREVQKEMVRSSLKDCVTNWLKEPSRLEAARSNGSAPRSSKDKRISEDSVSSSRFSDPEVVSNEPERNCAVDESRPINSFSEPPLLTLKDPNQYSPDDVITKSDRHTVAHERKSTILAFKEKGIQAGIKITDEKIAKAANPSWNDRTIVMWWKSNDPRCQPEYDRLIRKLLTRDPATIWEPR